MKHRALCFIVVVTLAVLICGAAAAAVWRPEGFQEPAAFTPEVSGNACLPASLLVIEEEAFAQTGLITVQLPDGLTAVGDRAFADIPQLALLIVPDSVEAFGRDVLSGSLSACVSAEPGSAAADWARANGYRLTPVMTLTAGRTGDKLSLLRMSQSEPAADDTTPADFSRQTGRSDGERKAADCVGHFALNVRTRCFP